MAKEIVKSELSQASSNGASLPSFEPDILPPHQYLKTCQRANPVEPEKVLRLAVLAKTIDTYQSFAFSTRPAAACFFVRRKPGFGAKEPPILFSRFAASARHSA
jgi:hypothetical protein